MILVKIQTSHLEKNDYGYRYTEILFLISTYLQWILYYIFNFFDRAKIIFMMYTYRVISGYYENQITCH